MRATREELMIVLRSLERQGLIASYSGSDGQVRWRLTEKGIRFPNPGMRGRSIALREIEQTTPTTIIVGIRAGSRSRV
jgi:DNA-binding PadR family transcriptional regulator